MTVNEAIKILKQFQAEPRIGCYPNELRAIGLGIEALKGIKQYRKELECSEDSGDLDGFNIPLLPGETEE